MIDLKELRAHPDRMRKAIHLRKVDPTKADLDGWLALDERRRGIEGALQELNAEKNKLAQFGRQDPDAARQSFVKEDYSEPARR